MARSDARMNLLDATLTAWIIEGADVFDERGLSGFCADHGLSRSTANRHAARIRERGRWELDSRRPRSSPTRTPDTIEARIIALRGKLGRDNGADNIRYELTKIAAEHDWAGKGWKVPARSTINNILTRHGLVTPEPKKRPKSSYRRFQYARPRDCYQIDATEVVLSGGGKATVFEVLDDCTRTLVATYVCHAETTAGAITAIGRAFTDYGVPAIVLSDNGMAFCATASKGRSKFGAFVTGSGARLIHSSPYHPQTNGKVERHHRTFKPWLTDQPTRPATTAELQTSCNRYQKFYNNDRRHSAVNMPPQQAWNRAATLGGPQHLPTQVDATVGTHSVSGSGVISVGDHTISVGRPHAHTRVTVLRDGTHITTYTASGEVLGHLHLNTDKRYQGQLHRPAA